MSEVWHRKNIKGVSVKRLKGDVTRTIRNDDFHRNKALQCWNKVASIKNNVATMLQRCVVLQIIVANPLV